MKKNAKNKSTKKTNVYYRRNPLMRHIALAIFTLLPFLGFLLGYWVS